MKTCKADSCFYLDFAQHIGLQKIVIFNFFLNGSRRKLVLIVNLYLNYLVQCYDLIFHICGFNVLF